MSTIPREQRLLRRSRSDRVVGGVCGGLARYFDIDPIVVRLIFVAMALAQGAGVLLYVLLWVLIPDDGTERAPAGGELVRSGIDAVKQDVEQAAERLRAGAPHRQGAWLGALLVAFGAYLLAANSGWLTWSSWTLAGPVLLIVLGLYLLLRRLR